MGYGSTTEVVYRSGEFSHRDNNMQLFLEWVAKHVPIVGWGTVIVVGVKVVRFFTIFGDRIERADRTLTNLSENHMKHMESSLGEIDGNVRGLREDMKEMRSDFREFFLTIIGKQ